MKAFLLLVVTGSVWQGLAFQATPFSYNAKSLQLYSTTTPEDVSTWRVSQLKQELTRRGVSFTGCFDKESLVQKLLQADIEGITGDPSGNDGSTETISDATNFSSKSDTATSPSLDTSIDDIRAMRVKDLRQELASNNIRWAGMLEKEDLAQAVFKARQEAATFSVTGKIRPGQVADLTGPEAMIEAHGGKTPLLLDVYAVWCGPCKMMAQELTAAAMEWQTTMRVAKFDSDKHPQQASKLRVNGLPTLVLFQDGHERARLEGALPKDQLMAWVKQQLR